MKPTTALQTQPVPAYTWPKMLCIMLLSLAAPIGLLAQEKEAPKPERKLERKGDIIVLRKNLDGTLDTLNQFAQDGEKEVFEFRQEDGKNGFDFRFDGQGEPHVKIWGDKAWEARAKKMTDSLQKKMKPGQPWAFGWSDSDDGKRNGAFRFRFKGPKGERRYALPPPAPGRPFIPDWPEMPHGAPGFAPDAFFFHNGEGRMRVMPPRLRHLDNWDRDNWDEDKIETKSTLAFEQFMLAPEGTDNSYHIKLRTAIAKDPIRIKVYNSQQEVVFTDTGRGEAYEGRFSLHAFGSGAYLLEIVQGEKVFSRRIFAK